MDSLVLSKTRMRDFMQCPEKYRLGYVLELQPILTSSGLLEGILIHELIETCLTTKSGTVKLLKSLQLIVGPGTSGTKPTMSLARR